MAKHRKPKSQAARKATLAGVAAAGISGALVAGHATNMTAMSSAVDLANTVIGVGGLGDDTGVRVPPKLSGTVVPAGYTYQGLQYDSGLNLAASRDAGTPVLNAAILDADNGQKIIVVGYSAGTLTVEQERRDLQQLDPSEAPSPDQLSFVQIANPFTPNGGIFARFPGIPVPGLIDAMGPGQPTRYDTTYVVNEYDPYGDFPAYFNPVSLLNTVLALRYSHPDEAYNPVIPGTTPAYVTTVDHTVDGTNSTDTYVLYYRALPLLGPLRELATQTGLTPFSEPFISAVEPLLRLVVDMGYTDRVNANPGATVPFSIITPPQNVIAALASVPGAISQGVSNLLSGGTAPTALPNPLDDLVPASTAPAVEPQMRSSQARLSLVADDTPTANPTPTTNSAPSSTVTASAPSSSAPTSTPPTTKSNPPAMTSNPASTGEVTHPTPTSDGNKAVPGGGTGESSGSGTATGTGTGATTTTTTTTTGTTGTTAGSTGGGETGGGTAAKDAAA